LSHRQRQPEQDHQLVQTLFWSNANLYGGIDIDMDRRLDLGLAA
jgi:hypothetical protein